MVESVVLGGFEVLETNVSELNRAVLDFGEITLAVVDIALFVQHLANAVGTRFGHREHNENHRQHHKAHQNLHRVGEKRHQAARGETERLVVAARNNSLRAEPRYQNNTGVNGNLHRGRVQGNGFLRFGEQLENFLRDFPELAFLVFLADKALYNANTAKIFLDNVVEVIVGCENLSENREGEFNDKRKNYRQKRYYIKENHCKLAVGSERENKRENQHRGRSEHNSCEHLKRRLNVCNIGCKTRDKACRREFVDVREAVILDIVEHIVADVSRKN